MGLTREWSGYWGELTMMRNRADALSLRIFLQRGWVVKSLANRQLSTCASLMDRKFLPEILQGGMDPITTSRPLILLASIGAEFDFPCHFLGSKTMILPPVRC
jgi:hypothetical protein